MTNKTETIYIIHECEGPSLIRAFTKEEDARNYFNHEVAAGKLCERYYKISPMQLEDMAPVVITEKPSNPLHNLRLQSFIDDQARALAAEWIDSTYQLDAGSRQVAIIVVADKIKEIVNDPTGGEYGFRRAYLYLEDCKFENSKLVHTPRNRDPVNFVGRP